MKIEMVPTVSSWNIEQEFGIDVLECEFTQMVENDSYVTLWLDEDRAYEIREEIHEFLSDGEKFAYVERLKNELNLINKFHEIGYTDSILVYVSW